MDKTMGDKQMYIPNDVTQPSSHIIEKQTFKHMWLAENEVLKNEIGKACLSLFTPKSFHTPL